jgi:hypothetical protein
MAMVDPFVANGFDLLTLTNAINIIPNRYSLLTDMGMFPVRGVSTHNIMIEMQNHTLNLIPTAAWGSPSYVNNMGRRNIRSLVIPHMPVIDAIDPSDVQGVRAFGLENTTYPLEQLVTDKLVNIRAKMDLTHEWRRVGALKGQILDADGTTVIYDLYKEFDVMKPVKNLDLGNTTTPTNVRSALVDISRYIEVNLHGETMTGTLVLCSPQFFDALVDHPNVIRTFQNWTAAREGLGGDLRAGFTFGGLTFREYRGSVPAIDINGAITYRDLIDKGTAIAFPMGTTQTFTGYAAPANFNETVNTIGVEYYAKTRVKEFELGYEMHVQSNVLHLTLRPQLVVTLGMDAASLSAIGLTDNWANVPRV